MYGYIRFYRDELKMKDYDLFRAYYCGLCRELKNRFGLRGRMLLSYDMTFLALFLDGIANTQVTMEQGFCPASPLRKKTMAIPTEGIKKAAELSLIMGYHKLKDAKEDKEFFGTGLALALYRPGYKKCQNNNPVLTEGVSKKLENFYQGEKTPGIDLDLLTDPFASLVAEVMSSNGNSEEERQTLYKMGYHAGRWLYFIDALDDLPKDFKKHAFNAFASTLPYPKETWESFYKKARGDIYADLFVSLDELSKDFKTLTIQQNEGLIENIFFLGIRGVTELIITYRDEGREDKFAQSFRIQTSCQHDAVTEKE